METSLNYLDFIGDSSSKEFFLELLEKLGKDKNPTGTPKPVQLFLKDPSKGISRVNPLKIERAKKLIAEHNIQYFTHSVFIINLSRPVTKNNPTSEKWILGLLSGDLRQTSEIGGRGVVVHVGKSVDMTVTAAVDKMESSIKSVLPFATDKCPLLLETPAGQGNETLCTFEEFSDFYLRFKGDPKFKVCIDSCHIFASGYDPVDYTQRWIDKHGASSIGLIHFNDSADVKGSCKDRHARVGHIGEKRMYEFAELCHKHNLPTVYEC
jgi:deoxyribonuclease-4